MQHSLLVYKFHVILPLFTIYGLSCEAVCDLSSVTESLSVVMTACVCLIQAYTPKIHS